MASSVDSDKRLMRRAIACSRRGIREGQTPFGACIARGGKVLACAHNSVWAKKDITAHAEITAIRAACGKLGCVDLSGCTIYSTTEPCPMCFSAIHWAKIGRIVYGTKIADAQKAGFSELTISNHAMKRRGKSPVKVEGGLLAKECKSLFKEWGGRKDKRVY
jgi:guanine deaminase